MVGKKPPTPAGCSLKKSPGEPALAQRLRRNISPKNLDLTAGLSWREERELNKALYASLQETKKLAIKSEIESDAPSLLTNSIPRRNLLARVLPRRQSPRSSRPAATSKSSLSMRSPSLPPPADKKLKSHHNIGGGDESSQDSVRSSTTSCSNEDSKGRTKVRAQRKFAQMHAYGNTMVPSQHTPVKQSSKTSSPIKVFPKRAKTEDFLTFLCLRGTQALPPHLDFFNFSRDEGDTSLPPTPPNRGRAFVRESSPSSSSTSCSNVPDDVADSPAPLVMPPSGRVTPSRKAARACAGTPETARGLASFPSRQGQRSQAASKRRYTSPAVTPAKCTRSYRTGTPSPGKGTRGKASPGKMTDAERLKKKAIATLTSSKHSPDQKTRRKSLFIDQSAMDEKPGSQRQTKVTGVSDTSSVVTGTNSCWEEARDSEGVSKSCSIVDLPQISCSSTADIVHASALTAKSTPLCCTSQSGTLCLDNGVSISAKQYSSQMLPACQKCSLTDESCICAIQMPCVSYKDGHSCPTQPTEWAISSHSPTPPVSSGDVTYCPTQTPLTIKSSVPSLAQSSVSTEDGLPCSIQTAASTEGTTPIPIVIPSVSTEDGLPCSIQTAASTEGTTPIPIVIPSVSTEDVISFSTQTPPTEVIIPSHSPIPPVSTEDTTSCPTQTSSAIEGSILVPNSSVSTEDVISYPTQTSPAIEGSIPIPISSISTEDVISYPTQTSSAIEGSILVPISSVSTEDVISYPTQTSPSIEGSILIPISSVSTGDVISCSTQTPPPTEVIIPSHSPIPTVSTEDTTSCPTQTSSAIEGSILVPISSVSTEDVISYPTQTSSAIEGSIPVPISPVSTEDVISYPTQTSSAIEGSIPVPISPVSTEDMISYPTAVSIDSDLSFNWQTSESSVDATSFDAPSIPSPSDIICHPPHKLVSVHDALCCDVISCSTPAPSVSMDGGISWSSQLPEPNVSLNSSFDAADHLSSQLGPLIKSGFNTECKAMMNECQSCYLDIEVRKNTKQNITNTYLSQTAFDNTKSETENTVYLHCPSLTISEKGISNDPSKSHSEITFENICRLTRTENENLPSTSDTLLEGVGDSLDRVRKRITSPHQTLKIATPLSLGCAVDDSGFIESLESSTLASPFPKNMPQHMSLFQSPTMKLRSPETQTKHKDLFHSPTQASLSPKALPQHKSLFESPTLTTRFPKNQPRHKGILAKYRCKTSTPSSKARTRKEAFVSFLLPPMSASPKSLSHIVAPPRPKSSSTSKIMRIDPPASHILDPPACHLIASPTSNFPCSPLSDLPLSSKPVVHARVDNCPIIANASILPHPAPPYSVLTSIRERKLADKFLNASSVNASTSEIEQSKGSKPAITTLYPPPPALCFRDTPL